MRRAGIGAVLVTAGVLVAGCGGSGGGSAVPAGSSSSSSPVPGTTSASPTATGTSSGGGAKAAFVAEANAVCADLNRSADKLSTPPNTAEGIAAFFDKGLVFSRTAARRLRALTPPPGDEATFDRILADVDSLNGLLGRAAAALHGGDMAQARRLLGQVEARSDKVDREFEAYGLHTCAE